MAEKTRIMVADDEPKILMFIRANLAARGYEVHVAQDGVEAVDVAARVIPDVIVLDVNMPRMDGVEACRRIREWSNVPIIMLSVRDDEVDKVRALDEGADDYVTKPFGIEELLARIRVALRRSKNASSPSPTFVAGDLEVDFSNRVVQRHGKVLKLTPTEYELLYLLANHPGKPYSRSDLVDLVWGYEAGGDISDGAVNTCIAKLRSKIEPEPAEPRYILSVHAVGYKFKEF